jgi:spore coat protein H
MKLHYSISASLLLVLFFTACESYNNVEHIPSVSGDIVDSVSWYEDANNDVLEMNILNPIPNEYLCTPSDNTTAPLRPCTMEDINSDTDPYDTYAPALHVNMSSGSFETSPQIMNATLKIKGGYTRFADQKSYSLKLDSDAGLFMYQRKFMLTKSQSDSSRIKNKLAFDLFRIIPNITSLKVQFLHIFINNVDYGLFNQPEAIRKEYLINRGWNKDDHLYNATNFLFNPLNQLALNAEGEPLDLVAFEKVIEIKNGKDHSKLIEMIDAIATTNNIDEVVAKYFNRNNYLTWLAINLILNNKDTVPHNFYLYNPLYSDTFYFLPWDYDGAWSSAKYLSKEKYGISVWWESSLHRKFLSVAKNRDDLYALADTLREKYITDDFIKEKIAEYENSVRPFQSVVPDNAHNSDNSWITGSTRLWSTIPANIAMYKSVIGDPMPFNVSAEYIDSNLSIKWGESVDLEGDAIVYDLIVSSDSNLSDISTNLISIEDINATTYTQNINLASGTYYIQVLSKEYNNSENYQISYEKVDVGDETLYGVLGLEVQ